MCTSVCRSYSWYFHIILPLLSWSTVTNPVSTQMLLFPVFWFLSLRLARICHFDWSFQRATYLLIPILFFTLNWFLFLLGHSFPVEASWALCSPQEPWTPWKLGRGKLSYLRTMAVVLILQKTSSDTAPARRVSLHPGGSRYPDSPLSCTEAMEKVHNYQAG